MMPVHPYIPNSAPETKKEMLREIGVKNVEELFRCIPKGIRLKKSLDLPGPLSEYEVRRSILDTLAKNRPTTDLLSFLGAGCWPHYVPAVCDEINSRSEFLTSYTGDVYTDLGRYQTLFEFQSMIGDLVSMDVVGFPLYDWSTATGDAARMSAIITGRKRILVPKTMSPDRLAVMRTHVKSKAQIEQVDFDPVTGQMSIDDLKRKISSDTAAVHIENPSYLGFVEEEAELVGQIAHDHGALFTVGVEPLSLGLLKAPGDYGADIVCGEGQPLGMHMSFGGALIGFLATRDEERFVSATGNRLITLTTTDREGEIGFAYVMPERTIFCSRDKAPTFTGTASVLWAITAAVYMSLLGPKGMQDLASTVAKKASFAAKRISEIPGLRAPLFDAFHFKEFTVNFDDTGKNVDEVNRRLLSHSIQGGRNLLSEFPELGSTSLFCVTELHTLEDINRLASALEEIVR